MEFAELILKRQSCRSFNGKPVRRERLVSLIEAARLSPSACNSQPWRFIIVDDEEKCAKLAKLLQDDDLPLNKFTENCKSFIVVCEGKAQIICREGGKRPNQRYAQLDLGMAVMHLCFAAADQGLDTCILGWIREKEIQKLLNIPEKNPPRLIIAVGYGAKSPIREKVRRPLQAMIGINSWGDMPE